MCLNGIDTSRQYKFALDYVYKSLNDLTQHVQKTNMNPTDLIERIDSVKC